MSLGPWLAASLFCLGLIVGSFLNVVIARLPAGESIVHPGSRCPRCGAALRWFENVPLLSWLVLRARCRSCHAPISARYPAVELLTGCLFLACWFRFGMSWPLLRGLLLVGFLVPLAVIDLETWILPFELTLSGIAVGVLSAGLLDCNAVRGSAIGATVGFLSFWGMQLVAPPLVGVVRWVTAFLRWALLAFRRSVLRKQGLDREAFPAFSSPEEGLGEGDKWLVALLGAFLGWRALFGVVLFSSVQGAVVGIALLLVRGRAGPAATPAPTPGAGVAGAGAEEDDWQPGATHLPYGPWLALAGLEVLLLGPLLHEFLPGALAGILVGEVG